MNTTKRIYSINLGAYVMATTNLIPELLLDEESQTYYMVFPQCAGVATAIRQFKCDNPQIEIHNFLHAIKQIRESMGARRNG